MKNRNYTILRMLQRPSITYAQIGARFGITYARVSQIRQNFIEHGALVPDRYKDIPEVLEDLKNAKVPNEQILKKFKLTKNQLAYVRQKAKNKGHTFPFSWRN